MININHGSKSFYGMRSNNLPNSQKAECKIAKLGSFLRKSQNLKEKSLRKDNGIRRIFAIPDDEEIMSKNDILSPKFRMTNQMLHSIDKIAQASGFLNGIQVSDEWLERMQERALILEAHHSTHIEGTELSLDQSQRLLKGEEVSDVKVDDAKELKNYRTAFNLVAKYIESNYPLTEVLIREIHKSLVSDVRGNSATPGEYRKIQNYVSNSKTNEVIYTPPEAYQVPILMRQLVDWINDEKEIHPVLVAGIAQFQLVDIHPFLDGNGRTARLLSTLCLYKSDYNFRQLFTLSQYYDRNRQNYYRAIQKTRDDNMDLTYWLEYFTLGLATQMTELEEKSKEAAIFELNQSLEQKSQQQKRSFELLGVKIAATIKKYTEMSPLADRKKLKNDIFYLLDELN